MSTNTAARRAREKHERREAILDAAERVFGAKGAHAATMDDVAEAAEVSKGTVYLYFRSKDELYLALTHRPLDHLLARLEALRDEPIDGLERLRRMIETHIEVVDAHRPFFRAAIASMCGNFEPEAEAMGLDRYGDRVRRLHSLYLEAVVCGAEDGSMRDDLDPELVTASLRAALFGANVMRMNSEHFQRRFPDAPMDFERLLPTLTDLLLGSLRSSARDANVSSVRRVPRGGSR